MQADIFFHEMCTRLKFFTVKRGCRNNLLYCQLEEKWKLPYI